MKEPSKKSRLGKILRVFREHPRQDLTIDEIAAEAGLPDKSKVAASVGGLKEQGLPITPSFNVFSRITTYCYQDGLGNLEVVTHLFNFRDISKGWIHHLTNARGLAEAVERLLEEEFISLTISPEGGGAFLEVERKGDKWSVNIQSGKTTGIFLTAQE